MNRRWQNIFYHEGAKPTKNGKKDALTDFLWVPIVGLVYFD